VQRTRDTTADSRAGCRPRQTCGNAIFDLAKDATTLPN